jgi:hypothetical protein
MNDLFEDDFQRVATFHLSGLRVYIDLRRFGCGASGSLCSRTQPTATGFLFSRFLVCSNANAICSTPQSS